MARTPACGARVRLAQFDQHFIVVLLQRIQPVGHGAWCRPSRRGIGLSSRAAMPDSARSILSSRRSIDGGACEFKPGDAFFDPMKRPLMLGGAALFDFSPGRWRAGWPDVSIFSSA